MITPFIRYVGSKRRALDTILSKIPPDIKEYREPMIGGGSVLLGLLQTRKRPEKIVIGDLDYDIYNLWHQLLYNTDELAKHSKRLVLDILEGNINPETRIDTFGLSGVEAASIVLVSNLCRTYGNYGNLDVEKYKERLEGFNNTYKYKLYGVANLVGNVEIRHADYEWAFTELGENVCIFLDPPYYNISNNDGYYISHTNFDYVRLIEIN